MSEQPPLANRPPLRFVAPPGWPEPSDEWVARNQGYRPPAGWLPPGASPERVPAAPAAWRFWRPDDQGWRAFRRPFVRSGVVAVMIGWFVLAVGAGFTVVGYLGVFGGGVVVMFGLMAAGVVRLVTGYRALFAADRRAWKALGARMPEIRDGLDAHAHARSLRERAEQGAGADGAQASLRPKSVSEVALDLELRPWRFADDPDAPAYVLSEGRVPFPAVWPGVRWTVEPPWIVERRLAARPRRRRITIGVLGGVVVALALAVAIPLAVNPTHTLTNSSLPKTGSARAPSAVLVTDDDWKVVDTGKCSSSLGCWQLQVTPESSCRDAVIVWGFTNGQNGNVRATRSTSLPLVNGRQTHVTIPITTSIEADDYIQLDDASCRG